MDITETQDAYELTADAPGMDQSNIDIQLHEGMLTIKGHRQLAKEEKDAEGRVVRRERTMSHFTRHFTLPDNVDQEGVTASLDKGVLTLRLPKVTPPPKPEPKRITVAAAPVAAPQAVEAAPAGAELPAAAPAAAPEAGGSA
jgi:HSP20 family protein